MKETRELKRWIKNKVKFTQALLVAFLITGGISYAAENVTITNVGEKTGIELGTDSRARGIGSIATGKNAIALGKNAVATGGNETKETIDKKLQENKATLENITNAKKTLAEKTSELALKQAKERATIEAGVRVEELKKAKANAKLDWERKEEALKIERENSKSFLEENKRKINELNGRLAGMSKIPNVDISSEEGLIRAARELKSIAEKDTTLNLSEGFYKDYVSNYYKALGDLREKERIASKTSDDDFTNNYNNNVENIRGKYTNLGSLNEIGFGISDGFHGMSFHGSTFLHTAFDSEKDFLTNLPQKSLTRLNEKIDILSLEEYSSIQGELPKYKQSFQEYFKLNNDVFLTPAMKEKAVEIFDAKIDIYGKKSEIAYYQGQYESTKNTTWLDKKKVASNELENMLSSFSKFSNVTGLKRAEIEKFKKENITSVVEKNKITVEKLSSELETALGINKNAIAEKEKELKGLEKEMENAKNNYNSLNPSEKDLILAKEYERVRAEIDELSKEIVASDERVKALEKIALHDLKNVGENQIAMGTNALAIGNNAIAFGTKSSTVGENSISIGTETTTVGTQSINIGYRNVLQGNHSGVFGDPNLVYGDNNFVIGNNNKIGAESSPKNNVFLLGSNIDATSVDNAVVLGNASTAVAGAISVGSTTSLRGIKFVAPGTEDTDAVTLAQLKALSNTSISIYSGGSYKNTYTMGESKFTFPLSTLQFDFGNGLKAEEVTDADGVTKRIFVGLDKEKIKRDSDLKGPQGDPGVAGTNGKDGAKGDKGDKGDPGLNGVNGKDGKDGVAGPKGEQGDPGVAGTNGKDGTADLTGEVAEKEEKGVKGKVIDKHLKDNYVNKKEKGMQDKMIINNYKEIQANKAAIAENTRRIEQVDKKVNKTAALAQATANLDFGQVKVGKVVVGAGVGNYMSETGVSVGIAYRPTEAVFMTAKWSGLAGEPRYNSYGASISYQVN